MQSKEYFYHLTGKFIIIRYYCVIDDEFGHCLICEIYENNKRKYVVIWFSAKHRPQIVLNLLFWWEKSLFDSQCSVFQRDFFFREERTLSHPLLAYYMSCSSAIYQNNFKWNYNAASQYPDVALFLMYSVFLESYQGIGGGYILYIPVVPSLWKRGNEGWLYIQMSRFYSDGKYVAGLTIVQ